MSDGLDILGAGEGLATKYIVLRVKHVDTDKLGKVVSKKAGVWGAATPFAVFAVDQAPDVALKAALPYVVKMASDDYGVDLDGQIMDAPPPPGQKPKSNLLKGVVLGAGLTGAGIWAWGRFGIGKLLGL